MATKVVPADRKPLKPALFDANLEMRAAAAAAITTVGGDYTSPDYASSVLDLGPGAFIGRLVIQNIALTLDAANDTYAHVALIGLNEAADTQVELAALRLGCKEVTLNTNDTAAAGTGLVDVDLLFSNVLYETIWPKLKLVVVTGGTSISLDFTAFITPLQAGNSGM